MIFKEEMNNALVHLRMWYFVAINYGDKTCPSKIIPIRVVQLEGD